MAYQTEWVAFVRRVPPRGRLAGIMHPRSEAMLQRNRVALAWSAGLAMVLVMSSPASAQIQDPGLAWVTIDDSTGSPVFTFGQTNDQNGPSGLFDSSNS